MEKVAPALERRSNESLQYICQKRADEQGIGVRTLSFTGPPDPQRTTGRPPSGDRRGALALAADWGVEPPCVASSARDCGASHQMIPFGVSQGA